VVTATLAAMAAHGSPAVAASIGPSICGGCYEVPGDLRDEVAGAVPGTATTTRWGTPALDLAAGVRRQLEDAGVAVEHHRLCTVEDDRFFSYRRDGITGRFAGFVARAS
jgi:copper oxidase (laccase) domain-containing protein